MSAIHVGRAWEGHATEDECPCPQEPCGLVSDENFSPDCVQHRMDKTIRQGHDEQWCPGPAEHEDPTA